MSDALSHLFFRWVTPILDTGFRRPLQQADIDRIRETLPKWDFLACASASSEYEAVNSGSNHSLVWGLYRSCKREFWLAGAMCFARLIIILSLPICLERILSFLASDDPAPDGWRLAALMLALTCCKTLLENHYFITMQRCGIRCLGIVVRLIFRKAMQLAPSARAAQKAGKILNLMQLDAQRFYDTAWFVHLMWSALFEVIGSTILLFLLLGPSMFAGKV